MSTAPRLFCFIPRGQTKRAKHCLHVLVMFVQGLSLHRQAMVTSLRTFTTAIYYYCVAVLYIYHHMQFTHIRHANPFLQYVFVVVVFYLSIYIELDDGVHIHNHTRGGGGGWSWSSTQEEGTEWHFP